jgi:hypothetical protein
MTPPDGDSEKARRAARLAETLRANLLKRKQQSRARRQGEPHPRPEGLAGTGRPATPSAEPAEE